MKALLAAFAALVLSGNCSANEPVCTDTTTLAAAYAKAFKSAARLPASIVYESSGQTEIIKDIIEIKAIDGTLLVTRSSGSRQILDATRVVKITDGN